MYVGVVSGGVLPPVVLSRAAERHARYLPLRYHFITIILLFLLLSLLLTTIIMLISLLYYYYYYVRA